MPPLCLWDMGQAGWTLVLTASGAAIGQVRYLSTFGYGQACHVTNGISHIPFLDFESQQHRVLKCCPVTVTHCIPNVCCC